MRQLCHIRKTSFHSSPSHPLLHPFFPFSCIISWILEGMIQICHLGLSLCSFLALWPVVSACAKHRCKRKLLRPIRAESRLICGCKHDHLEDSLTLLTFKIIDPVVLATIMVKADWEMMTDAVWNSLIMWVLFQGWLYIISKLLQPRRSRRLSSQWKHFNSSIISFLNFRIWSFWETGLQ